MPASLLSLPYELREQIMLPELQQKGTIELQHPVWANRTVFFHPLMQTCRSLRDEAIQTFYSSNVFLWRCVKKRITWISRSMPNNIDNASTVSDHVDVARDTSLTSTVVVIECEPTKRSDPATYVRTHGGTIETSQNEPLTSPLPWQYPHVFRDIRHLRVKLLLPSPDDAEGCTATLPNKLASFVQQLDFGHRLKDLHVLIGSHYSVLPYIDSGTTAFAELGNMQVHGDVRVQFANIRGAARAAIVALDLETRMKILHSG